MLRSYRPSGCWIDGLARRRHRAHHDRQPLPSRVEESGLAIGCRPPRLGAECVDQGRYYLARKARIQSPVDEARARKVTAVGVVECIEDHLDAMTYTSDHRLCKTERIRRIVLKALCRTRFGRFHIEERPCAGLFGKSCKPGPGPPRREIQPARRLLRD